MCAWKSINFLSQLPLIEFVHIAKYTTEIINNKSTAPLFAGEALGEKCSETHVSYHGICPRAG